jgi:hypothetical protein
VVWGTPWSQQRCEAISSGGGGLPDLLRRAGPRPRWLETARGGPPPLQEGARRVLLELHRSYCIRVSQAQLLPRAFLGGQPTVRARARLSPPALFPSPHLVCSMAFRASTLQCTIELLYLLLQFFYKKMGEGIAMREAEA